jgi:tape measure domain-containing protein
MTDAPATRASDADRERAAAQLQRHFAEGRVTMEELEERLARVYAARTLAELYGPDGAMRDLPPLMPPRPDEVSRYLRPR